MNNSTKVIWLEDNPSLLKNEREVISQALDKKGIELLYWDGIKENGDKSGKACLDFFQKAMDGYSDDIIGFILDIRIPVPSLEQLDMGGITTRNGLMTGVDIAYYYLRNGGQGSPVKDKFKGMPILLLSIAAAIHLEVTWIDRDPQCDYLVKGGGNIDNNIQQWINTHF